MLEFEFSNDDGAGAFEPGMSRETTVGRLAHADAQV